MSYNQEIYDAVRSRISGGDVGHAVQDVAREVFASLQTHKEGQP